MLPCSFRMGAAVSHSPVAGFQASVNTAHAMDGHSALSPLPKPLMKRCYE
jgi:hypothetical protein